MSAVAKKLTTVDGDSAYVDSENIQHLRESENGRLEYSLDGEVWLPVRSTNIVGPIGSRARSRRDKKPAAHLKEMKVVRESETRAVYVTDVHVDA